VALRSDQDWDDMLDPLRITPDSAQVIYLADQETPEAIELFRAPLDGSQITARMNETLAVGPIKGDVFDFEFAPGGKRIVYLADQDEDEVVELYSVPTSGRERAVKLNGDLVAGGDVQPGYKYLSNNISPDGSRVVYLADQDTNDVVELYSVPIDGSAPPVKLNGVLGISGDVTAFLIDPPSRRVTFRADPSADERFELFSAPIDGSTPAVRLSAPMVPGGALFNHRISADGARVVYLADQEVVDLYELYSAPIDGSAAPVKLNGTLAAGGGAYYYALSQDSRWVAYSAAQEAPDREDVYVSPIDGSSPPVRLSASAPGIDARDVLFTPDGTRVVFVVIPSTGPRALLVAPRDGSQPPLQLSGSEFVVGGYDRIELTPDGLRLLYIASVRGNYGLFAAPVDGSSPSVQLSASGQFVENGYLGPLLVSPAGRVVYVARIVGSYGTFSAPIDGSTAAVRLDTVSAHDSVLTADGRTVIYLRSGVLARVPIDGSALPETVVPGAAREVGDFEVSPDGDRIAFLVGVNLYPFQGPQDVVELFLRPLDLAPRSVDTPRRPERP
jgi:Tol biopolymer transport system component